MTARRLVNLATLAAFVGVLLLAPLNMAQAQSAGPANPSSSKAVNILDLALEVTGAVVGGLIGSHFGMIGTVVGGGLGFIVTKWVAENFFPHYGSLQFNDPFTGKPAFLGPPIGRGGWFGSGTFSDRDDNANLSALRDSFYKAMQAYQSALANGTDADKAAAKTAYDQARTAYFQAKYGSSH